LLRKYTSSQNTQKLQSSHHPNFTVIIPSSTFIFFSVVGSVNITEYMYLPAPIAVVFAVVMVKVTVPLNGVVISAPIAIGAPDIGERFILAEMVHPVKSKATLAISRNTSTEENDSPCAIS